MKKKPVNTYLTPKTIAQIEKTFPTTYHGLRTTIESFFVLRNYVSLDFKSPADFWRGFFM